MHRDCTSDTDYISVLPKLLKEIRFCYYQIAKSKYAYKTKVLLPQAYVTLDNSGYSV